MSARKENWNETDWKPNPPLAAPCRGAMEDQLESLKEQLLIPLLSSVENAALIQELRWVANEAAALAWCTVCPLLVLPALLEEKVCAARQRWERQQLLRKRQAPANTAQEATASIVDRFTPAVMAA
jgi:hypothetical protein